MKSVNGYSDKFLKYKIFKPSQMWRFKINNTHIIISVSDNMRKGWKGNNRYLVNIINKKTGNLINIKTNNKFTDNNTVGDVFNKMTKNEYVSITRKNSLITINKLHLISKYSHKRSHKLKLLKLI